MKLYTDIVALKNVNGKLIQVAKGQGSNQSLAIEVKAEGIKGIPTRANIYRLSLNIDNNNMLEAELLDYSTGEKMILSKGKQQKGESRINDLGQYTDIQ